MISLKNKYINQYFVSLFIFYVIHDIFIKAIL